MSLKNTLWSSIEQLPIVKKIASERDQLATELHKLRLEYAALKKNQHFAPPGHFYSPIPSLEEVKKDETKIFDRSSRDIFGVELNESKQLNLLEQFVAYYKELPFQSNKTEGLRYYYENPAYSYSDGILLHCMIRHLMPKQIVEVGSGFSSCMVLDTDELYCGGSIKTTFIEPYPDLLLSLINEQDKNKINVIPSRLQNVELTEFEKLAANDILFIDSTHVSKVNSDVNHIFFNILPRLARGVYIHFHDIFFPFEYPREWIYEGRAWNEAYMLRAFLQFNSAYQVVLMNTFMEHFHKAFFTNNMPLCLKNPGGSIWLCKT